MESDRFGIPNLHQFAIVVSNLFSSAALSKPSPLLVF
jgi:hypothetical protein